MIFNVIQFLTDHPQDTREEKRGWVQVDCPFCTAGERSHRLGINIEKAYGHCWQCGHKSMTKAIQGLLQCSWGRALEVEEKYNTKAGVSKGDPKTRPLRNKVVELPSGTGPLTNKHREYLEGRKFNPEWLEEVYGVKGTGPDGLIKMPDKSALWFKRRVVIPIIIDGQLISFQGRDITGKDSPKYMACPKELEAYDHKHSLYGLDQAAGFDQCVVVEGVTDVWRLGPGAVGTFGTAFLPPQVNLIADNFRRAFILYDKEKMAQIQAKLLALQLCAVGVECEIITINDDDPGVMSQWDADKLMYDLGFFK